MIVKKLHDKEYLITEDINTLAYNANVPPELLKRLLRRDDFSVSATAFGSMYEASDLPMDCPPPKPPAWALTHQVVGLPTKDASSEICQIKIRLLPADIANELPTGNLQDMIECMLNNVPYDDGKPLYLRQYCVLVPRIVDVKAPQNITAYSRSRPEQVSYPIDQNSEGGCWEIHGWDFIYYHPESEVTGAWGSAKEKQSSQIDGGVNIIDPATATVELYLDRDDPNYAKTIATMVNLYFSSETNQHELTHAKIHDCLKELDALCNEVRGYLIQESPQLTTTYVDELLVKVRAHALFDWLKRVKLIRD